MFIFSEGSITVASLAAERAEADAGFHPWLLAASTLISVTAGDPTYAGGIGDLRGPYETKLKVNDAPKLNCPFIFFNQIFRIFRIFQVTPYPRVKSTAMRTSG